MFMLNRNTSYTFLNYWIWNLEDACEINSSKFFILQMRCDRSEDWSNLCELHSWAAAQLGGPTPEQCFLLPNLVWWLSRNWWWPPVASISSLSDKARWLQMLKESFPLELGLQAGFNLGVSLAEHTQTAAFLLLLFIKHLINYLRLLKVVTFLTLVKCQVFR